MSKSIHQKPDNIKNDKTNTSKLDKILSSPFFSNFSSQACFFIRLFAYKNPQVIPYDILMIPAE